MDRLTDFAMLLESRVRALWENEVVLNRPIVALAKAIKTHKDLLVSIQKIKFTSTV